MYKIYADDLCIYDDRSPNQALKLASPKLTLSDSSAGSLTMTVPVTNIGYDAIQRGTTAVTVFKRDREIWSGRVLSEKVDFWKNRVLTCEGELAYLNDTIQPPAEYHGLTVRGFLETLISVHNSKVEADKQFVVGIVTAVDANDSLYRYTNYETTLACINDKLLGRLGGHLRVRKADGVRYIDYLAEYPRTSDQIIEFGKNLLDFTKNFTLKDFVTCLIPRGKQLDESPIEALTAYTTVASVNDGSIYVESPEAIAEYGRIEAVMDWSDVETPAALLSKARAYLADVQFDNMVLEVSAVDYNLLDISSDDIQLLDEILVRSRSHGLERFFPVTKLTLNLDNPKADKIVLGSNVQQSLTGSSNKTNSDIMAKIESIPKSQTILEEARANATQIIRNALGGHIHITDDASELLIMDTDDVDTARKVWRFNLNGLGYSSTGYNGEFGLALTMDGRIIADFVSTGNLDVDKLTVTGTLTDQVGNNYWNMRTGEAHFSSSNVYMTSEETVEEAIAGVSYKFNEANELIIGTQTSSTNAWSGASAYLTEITDGTTILYWLPYASDGDVTLELTLSDGTTTGAVPCYFSGNIRLDDQYGGGSVVRLTYRKSVSIDGARYTGWWAGSSYESYNADRLLYRQPILAGSSRITAGQLIVAYPEPGTSDDESDQSSDSTEIGGSYFPLRRGLAFDISYPILFAPDEIAANAVSNKNYIVVPMSIAATQEMTLIPYKAVYIKGKLTGSTFDPVAPFLTQTVPTEEDEYSYMLLGTAYTASSMYLLAEHPIFQYSNGAFKTTTQIAMEAGARADAVAADMANVNSTVDALKLQYVEIDEKADAISATVGEQSARMDGIEELVETKFEQTKNYFSFTFQTQEELEVFEKYIRFEDGKIKIGESGSDMTVEISNNRMSFMAAGSEVAYVSNQKLYIEDGEFKSKMNIADWRLEERPNQHMTLTWIGGDS